MFEIDRPDEIVLFLASYETMGKALYGRVPIRILLGAFNLLLRIKEEWKMLKRIFMLSFVVLIAASFMGCAAGVASKQQYPFMKGYGSVNAETMAITVRPIEYAVEDLGEVTGEAYEVRGFFNNHIEGDRPYEAPVVAFAMAAAMAGKTPEQRDISESVGPLTKIAIHRAIKSKAGADALYITNIEKNTSAGSFRRKISIVVTGRALDYKPEGPISKDRWDKRFETKE